MAFRDWFRAKEQRIITDIPGIERPGANMLQVYGLSDVSLPAVTIDSALSVPAVWAAVSFLSRTLAALPLHVYRKTTSGEERINGGLETLIREAPNPEWTSFKLRQHFWQQVFTGGRGFLYIERSGSNIVALWPIDPSKVTINRDAMGQTTYRIDTKVYSATDIIDVPFMLKRDGVKHYSPVTQCSSAIQLALAMNKYGSTFFAGGGVPPLAMEGPIPAGPDGMKRAMADMNRAIDAAKTGEKQVFPMPPGHKLTPIGFDPEKGQMTDARRFQVEEISRVFNLPPVFLQDLSRGTFSNTEQQDLHLVKHLVAQWAETLEQEMDLKLFGQRNSNRTVEHNLDGLMRGDFKTRADAVQSLVNCGVYTPNIGAKFMGLEPHTDPAANGLYMQGAMVPLGTQADAVPADNQGENSNGV